MYIETVPNRNSRPTILLREGRREGKKVIKRTLANLTNWPPEKVERLRRALKDEPLVSAGEAFDIERSLPHGHVAAVLGTLRKIGLDRIIDSSGKAPELRLVMAMIVARVINPGSKLALSRELRAETATSTLGEMLGIDADVTEDDLYRAMDWLVARQGRIEKKLADKHLSDGSLVLYDLTSTYFEGTQCPLAVQGHSRDGKKGTLQIVFGLLCNAEGCPVAVEVFEGNTGDAATLGSQIDRIRKRFGLSRVVLVGDRGMITEARIREEMRDVEGLDWITALRGSQIKKLVDAGSLQLSLFDERDLVEIRHPDYPGERLIACKNPLLCDRRRRERQELLDATERELEKIKAATERQRRPLRGKDRIVARATKVLDRYKVGKHFIVTYREDGLSFRRNEAKIQAEAMLDGIYVVRTSVPAETMGAEDTVGAYKGLSVVERAFRSMKTVDLKVRPIYHHLEDRVRAHVFLCMLAYYVEWHMRQLLATVLFDDADPEGARALRTSIVAPAKRSGEAKRKAATKRTRAGVPVHSFRTLLSDLATIAKHRIRPRIKGAPSFEKITLPTPVQKEILGLLGIRIKPARSQ